MQYHIATLAAAAKAATTLIATDEEHAILKLLALLSHTDANQPSRVESVGLQLVAREIGQVAKIEGSNLRATNN